MMDEVGDSVRVWIESSTLGVEAQLASEKDNKESDVKDATKWGTHNESECWIAHARDKAQSKAQKLKKVKSSIARSTD